MILVTGATGGVGRQLVNMLVDAELPVRALSRNPAAANLPSAVEVYMGSLDESDELDAAFVGVERVFSLTAGSNLPRHADNLVTLGQRHGVRHVVLMSSLAVELPIESTLKTFHEAAELRYMEAGFAWTMLRGGVFNTNSFAWVPSILAERRVRNFLRNDPYACIDTQDVAAVAAKILMSDGHFGKIYGLTGPERITPEDQVAILAEALGEPIDFIQLSEAEALDYFTSYVFPHLHGGGSSAKALLDLLRRTDLPWLEVRPDVELILGRKGRTYRDWAVQNIANFR